MNKPRYLRLVRSDPNKEQRIAATLWRCHARRQVEEEMRRQGIKPISITFAQFQERISRWVAAHPRPTNT